MEAEIKISGRKFEFTVPLGFGRPTPTGGGSQHEEVARPEDTAMTVFTGNSLIEMAVPVLLDGWGSPGNRQNVGPKIDQIVGLVFGADGNPPPDFRATYPGPFSGLRYRMLMPEWTEEPKPIVGRGGTVFRQALVLKLLQFESPDNIRFKAGTRRPPRRPNIRSGGLGIDQAAALTAEVQYDGETLQHVSARVYGTPALAKKIGDLNGIRSPLWQGLRKGQRLRLPADA